MRRTTPFVALALAFCLGCGNGNKDAPQVADDGVPKFADFSGDEEPRASVPDGMDITEIPLPLEQTGADTGQDGIVYAAVLGGYYLMRVQLEGGNFNYEYNIDDDSWSDEDSIHRQCGSTVTQAFLLRVTQREEFKVSARRGLDYLHGKTTVEDDGSLDLAGTGATALLTIATSIYTLHADDDEYRDELDLLGQNLLTKVDAETGEPASKGSIFLVPGQLMMALEHLHAATGDDVYLDRLELMARWVVANPDEHNWGSYFGLWANEPLTYLYARRPDDDFARAAYNMADPIVDGQHVPGEADNEEWNGGYPVDADSPAPSWSTCLRLEAVIDAYRMAVLHGDEEREKRYGDSSQWAAGYLMRLQFREGETKNHADPNLLLGAVPFRFNSDTVRVDVTHHVANSLVKVADYMGLEDFPGARDVDDVTP